MNKQVQLVIVLLCTATVSWSQQASPITDGACLWRQQVLDNGRGDDLRDRKYK